MIIHTPEIIHADDRIRIQARVETQTTVYELPDRFWFSFPKSYADFVSDGSDPFAASLIVLASYLGESLEVRGRISPRLAFGLNEYIAIYRSWLPRLFNPIELKFNQLEASPPYLSQRKVALAFSGGVDSLYTLWSHLPQNQPIPSARLDYAVFVHGFDFRLSQEEAYQRFCEHYTNTLGEYGVRVLSAGTNALLFYQILMRWQYAHGAPLAATAMCLDKLLGRFYISPHGRYTDLYPTGTSSILDHWLNTETLEIIHYGGGKNKYQKLEAMADWPVAHELLRVCTNFDKERIANCEVCWKCILTRTRLELLGALGRFKTFTQPFSYRELLRLVFVEDPNPATELRVAREAFGARRIDIALPYLILSLPHRTQKWLVAMLYRLLSKEGMYRLKRWIFTKYFQSDPLASLSAEEANPAG